MKRDLRNEDPGRYVATTATGSGCVLHLTPRTLKRQISTIAPLLDRLDADCSNCAGMENL
jgi:hypothetical protein